MDTSFNFPDYLYEPPVHPFVEVSFAGEIPVDEIPTATQPKTKKAHRLAKILAICGILLLLISWGPSLFLRLTGEANNYKIGTNLAIASSNYQPAIDRNLPFENRIKIGAIGVDGMIYEAQSDSYEEALRKGIWRVSDFGTPFDREYPTILAAHRFGYLEWSNLFRRHNSFYNLPKLKVGDTIDINWRQRKYTYAVYAEDKGRDITDYQADLILYTCEDLSSDIKIIKYARLLEI